MDVSSKNLFIANNKGTNWRKIYVLFKKRIKIFEYFINLFFQLNARTFSIFTVKVILSPLTKRNSLVLIWPKMRIKTPVNVTY